MRSLNGTLAQCCSHFLEASEHVMMQPDDLSDNDIGILAIFHEALHHGAK